MPTSYFSTTQHSNDQRLIWPGVLIILSIFLLFRLPGFGVPLASDELATVSLWAQMPYSKIFSNYQYPNNHIFLTLMLSVLLKTFGLKEWLLRVPLMACGIITLYLGYQLGRRISGGIAVGLFTAFLMAMTEKHIFFSTNARGYLVIMMLALMVVIYLLDRLEGRAVKVLTFSGCFRRFLTFSGWVGIWILGTWTVPTFLFFEVSVAIFIVGLVLAGNRLQPLKNNSLVIVLLSTVVGGIGFYLQYYVLIDTAMLAEATSNAAKSTVPLFFPELLAEWTSPFESVGILFFLLALLGLCYLFKRNQVTGFLIAFIWLGPVFLGIAGFLLEKLPGVPHARTYFYLQPIFLMLSVMGTREAGAWIMKSIGRKPDSPDKGIRAPLVLLAGALFFISGWEFFQNTYPQRMSREPLDQIRGFTQKLNSNDLLLVSNRMHVAFYLYGARDMQDRIRNILREGKLGTIYYLDYKNNTMLEAKEVKNREKRTMSFPRLIGNVEGPTIPEKGLEIAGQFGPFIFYRLKQDWLQPLAGWEKAGLDPNLSEAGFFKVKKVSSPSGIRPLIRFDDSFTVSMKSKEPQSLQASGLTLNLMEIHGGDNNFSAAQLGGSMKAGNIVYDPGWRANAWILDHPYGSDVFNRSWNPAVFISQGAGNFSVLDVKFFQKPGNGALRNFLSYRIDEPEEK
jgi:hypothetical protein